MDKKEFINYYLGVPYLNNGRTEKGLDCWGLVYLYYNLVLKEKIPELSETMGELRDFQKLNDPSEDSIVMLILMGKDIHVGVMIDEKRMIHCDPQVGVVIENVFNKNYKNRIEGFYR